MNALILSDKHRPRQTVVRTCVGAGTILGIFQGKIVAWALLTAGLVLSTAQDKDAGFREVFFVTATGAKISANLYAGGDHDVLLSPGAVFDIKS